MVDPDPQTHIWKNVGPGTKWIRIIKKFMSDKLQYLFLLPPKFRKRDFSDSKNILFYFFRNAGFDSKIGYIQYLWAGAEKI